MKKETETCDYDLSFVREKSHHISSARKLKRYRFIIGAFLTALSHIYTIQRINVSKNKKLRYPPDRDLSGGNLCLPFEEPEPGLYPYIYP